MPDRRPILPPFEAAPGVDATIEPEALDAQQAAALLGISRSAFLALDRDGQVPGAAIRIGRIVKFSKRELLAWLDAGAPPRARWSAIWAATRSRRVAG